MSGVARVHVNPKCRRALYTRLLVDDSKPEHVGNRHVQCMEHETQPVRGPSSSTRLCSNRDTQLDCRLHACTTVVHRTELGGDREMTWCCLDEQQQGFRTCGFWARQMGVKHTHHRGAPGKPHSAMHPAHPPSNFTRTRRRELGTNVPKSTSRAIQSSTQHEGVQNFVSDFELGELSPQTSLEVSKTHEGPR